MPTPAGAYTAGPGQQAAYGASWPSPGAAAAVAGTPQPSSVYDRSAAAGQPTPVPTMGLVDGLGRGRIDEEVNCLKTIAQCLEASFRYHSGPLPALATANSSTTTTVEETTEFFELIVSLLSADNSPQRLALLVFDVQPSILDLLVSLLEIPTPAHQRGNQAYLNCRILCVQTLAKVISLCTEEAAAPFVAERCLQQIAATPFVGTALAHLSAAGFQPAGAPQATVPLGSGSEGIRVAYAECLFVLVMRAEALAAVVVNNGGVQALFDCVFSDSSAMVRNYACAVMRVLAERAPEQFVNLPVVERAVMQIKVEHSKYVVILLFETLSILFYACPQIYLENVHNNLQLVPELSTIIQTFLSGNTNHDVLASVVKLMEAVLLLESSTCGEKCAYTTRLLTQNGTKILLARNQASEDIKLLKMRAFRKLIQACTSGGLCDQLHEAYRHFFPSLSLLINADGSGQEIVSPELRSELALCFATILAKHPASREYTHQTVKAYPTWIGQLRQHLLAAVDELSPPVLNGCHIVDAHNAYLNNIHDHPTVNWSDRVHVGQLVSDMLHRQEQAGTQPPGQRHMFVEESHDAPPGHLSDMERKARLTHAVLSHVIHITLAAGPTPLAAPGVASGGQQLLPHPDLLNTSFERGPLPSGAPLPSQQNPQQLSFNDSRVSEAFTDLQHYASSQAGGDAPQERGRANTKRLRGIFGKGARSKSPASTRTANAAASADRRPWNAGGNSFRNALFSAPKTGKRTNFAPGLSGYSGGAAAGAATPGTPRSGAVVASGAGSGAEDLLGSDYTDMAILMHLPITFGANYNRANKPTVRRFNCGSAVPYVQQTVKSNTFQSWDVKDVGEGDLFSFFIPFHKLTEARIDEELKRLARHKLKSKKALLTTPQNQKGRRWFHYDMYHYVLDKTDALLNELRELVAVHGQSNILFYLNIIRLMENKEHEAASEMYAGSPPKGSGAELAQGMLAQTPSQLDTSGMPADEQEREQTLQREVLKLSSGKYKDTVHGGNILYVLDRLRDYFAEQFTRPENMHSDHLKDIEDEIRRLEEKAARDVVGNEAAAEAEDDVESAYDSSDAGAGHGAPAVAGAPTAGGGGGGLYDEPDFSTDTESDVNYNLDRLRLGDVDSDAGGPPDAPVPGAGYSPYSAAPYEPSQQPRHVSPNRHRHAGVVPPSAQQQQALPSHSKVLAGDEWESDSSNLSF